MSNGVRGSSCGASDLRVPDHDAEVELRGRRARYAEAGLDGIGVWELKLAEGEDLELLELLEASGLESAAAVPAVPSILPLPLLGGPEDPDERVEAYLPLDCPPRPLPARVGSSADGHGRRPRPRRCAGNSRRRPEDDRRRGRAARLRVGIEPYQRDSGEHWSIATSIPDAVELIHEAGDPPTLGIQFDIWHLWNTPTLFDDIAREIERFTGVHVCDCASRRAAGPTALCPATGRPTCLRSCRRSMPRAGRSLRHRDLLRRRHVRLDLPRLVLGGSSRRTCSRRRATRSNAAGTPPEPLHPPRQ